MKITKIDLQLIPAVFTKTQEEYPDLELVDYQEKSATSCRFRLKVPTGKKGSRRSWSGRRGPWASWHVYRDFLKNLFEMQPNCTVSTAIATYKGKEDFEDKFPDTYYTNIGSQVRPAYFGSLTIHEDESN